MYCLNKPTLWFTMTTWHLITVWKCVCVVFGTRISLRVSGMVVPCKTCILVSSLTYKTSLGAFWRLVLRSFGRLTVDLGQSWSKAVGSLPSYKVAVAMGQWNSNLHLRLVLGQWSRSDVLSQRSRTFRGSFSCIAALALSLTASWNVQR